MSDTLCSGSHFCALESGPSPADYHRHQHQHYVTLSYYEVAVALVVLVLAAAATSSWAGRYAPRLWGCVVSCFYAGNVLSLPSDEGPGPGGATARAVPKHIAVIMDGNRRFGKKRHSDAMQGHWDGGKKLVECVEWSMLHGVQVLSVFAFSTENWSREPEEVNALMTIIAKYTETVKEEALARNVRVRILSTDRERLPPQVRHAVLDLEAATAACTAFRLNVCLNYGSRQEITAACRRIAGRVLNGEIDAASVDEALVEQELLTAGLPDPDLLIRTSGEHRISNFLLWQLSYAELYFVNKLWPELTAEDWAAALREYAARQRRYGA